MDGRSLLSGWVVMSADPGHDHTQDQEDPGDKKDQSPPEVVPNSDAAEPLFRSALKKFTAAAKRQSSCAVHRGIGVESRPMVGRDQQVARCLQSEVRRVGGPHRSVVENP
jgi:hypothetical protein